MPLGTIRKCKNRHDETNATWKKSASVKRRLRPYAEYDFRWKDTVWCNFGLYQKIRKRNEWEDIKEADKNNANIAFEKQIWDAACVLWGHIPAADYRKIIVGLIFLRYISNSFDKRYQELVDEGYGFENDKDAYIEENIFFVPENACWGKIAEAAHTLEIGTVIDDAMRAKVFILPKKVNLVNYRVSGRVKTLKSI